MKDYTLEYLEKNKIPVTRENYVGLNWLGDLDPKEPLPAELEAELPDDLQHPDVKNQKGE